MYTGERDRWRNECETQGIAWAKAAVFSFNADIQVHCREWIEEYERNESAEREVEQRRLSLLALQATQLAADTSKDAADASRKSARWTMVAAWAAAASALISAAVPVTQYLGYLQK